jgi:PelA/Pel-15E family pectate lyase
MIKRIRFLQMLFYGAASLLAATANADLREDAVQSMKKGAEFYRSKMASHGGYVYYHSEDLKQRWGEGRATADTIFVQPPGTPTVGMAYLKAYEATQDQLYLDAAVEAAEALVYGQLQSGGWTQTIHFGPVAPGERLGKYRNGKNGTNEKNGKSGSWNNSSLDDGQTQSALQFLARLDGALKFKHVKIHEAATFGFDALLKVQFPNGAFPQVWTKPVEPHPVAKPKYPDYDWRTEGRLKNYWDYYTLNDNLAGSVSETLIVAHRVYGDAKYKAALERLGDFLLLAQMPDPQPGWCQQYSYDMVPIWARKFEPPAVTAWESQDVLEVLITIAEYTGDQKYLEPIPRALAYLEKCLLPDGRVARYYELKTNKPLYMDQQYQLTYDDSAVPEHYGWKQAARFDVIREKYKRALQGDAADANPRVAAPTEAEVRRIIGAQDATGRWVSSFAGERLVGQPKFQPGFRYISSDVFSSNVEVLSRFVTEAK